MVAKAELRFLSEYVGNLRSDHVALVDGSPAQLEIVTLRKTKPDNPAYYDDLVPGKLARADFIGDGVEPGPIDIVPYCRCEGTIDDIPLIFLALDGCVELQTRELDARKQAREVMGSIYSDFKRGDEVVAIPFLRQDIVACLPEEAQRTLAEAETFEGVEEVLRSGELWPVVAPALLFWMEWRINESGGIAQIADWFDFLYGISLIDKKRKTELLEKTDSDPVLRLLQRPQRRPVKAVLTGEPDGSAYSRAVLLKL